MTRDEMDALWQEDAEENGWIMPCAPCWKRLPIIRHIRGTYHCLQAERYRKITAAMGLGLGGVPQCDRWVLYGIARGFERPMVDDYEMPYEEGYAAGEAGLDESDNPYSEDRAAAISWNGGWRDAVGRDPNALEGEEQDHARP